MDWIMAMNQLLERARVVFLTKATLQHPFISASSSRTEQPTDRRNADWSSDGHYKRPSAGRPPSLKLGSVPNSSVFYRLRFEWHTRSEKSSFVRSVHVCALTEWKSRTTTASFISVAWIIFGRSVKKCTAMCRRTDFYAVHKRFQPELLAILQ